MPRAPIISRPSRAERRGMVALWAVFALMVQILAPAFAAAAPRLPDGSLLICADGGVAPIGAPMTPAADDHRCDHCVCPAPVIAPSPAPSVERIAYAVHAAAPAPSPRFLIPPARAPPRPPGQGPPHSDA